MSKIKMTINDETRVSLTMLYLKNQDLSALTPEELVDKYKDTYEHIYEHSNQVWLF